MATKTKTTKKTNKKTTPKNTNRTSAKAASAAQPPKATKSKGGITVSFGWRVFWVLICVVISACLLIAVDDAIFGANDRIIANYSSEQTIEVSEAVTVPTSLSWEELVSQQLGKDIFVPIIWGTVFTLVEVFILYKARLINRSATSAILIAALWLLPITLAVIRLVSCYAFTFSAAA